MATKKKITKTTHAETIDGIVASCGMAAISEAVGNVQHAFELAEGIGQLREILSQPEVLKRIESLKNTALGFLTDEGSRGQGWSYLAYTPSELINAVTEALLRGLRLTGNEFNIISGRSYTTKWGLRRLVAEFPGVTDLVLLPGVPHLHNGTGALVPYVATWNRDGKAFKIERTQTEAADNRIAVKVNKGMGSDAILGKADRKMLASIYAQLTGSEVGMPDGDAAEIIAEQDAEGHSQPTPAKPSGVGTLEEVIRRKRVENEAQQAKDGSPDDQADAEPPSSQGLKAWLLKQLEADGVAPDATDDWLAGWMVQNDFSTDDLKQGAPKRDELLKKWREFFAQV